MKVAVGVPILAVSSITREGFDKLLICLKSLKTIVFLRSLGVGKYSLVNVVVGYETMEVNGIREDGSKGHHTTTHNLLCLKMAL